MTESDAEEAKGSGVEERSKGEEEDELHSPRRTPGGPFGALGVGAPVALGGREFPAVHRGVFPGAGFRLSGFLPGFGGFVRGFGRSEFSPGGRGGLRPSRESRR